MISRSDRAVTSMCDVPRTTHSHDGHRVFRAAVIGLIAVALGSPLASAQTPPEIGYVFPPCGRPGTTVDVRIGGYNWTPDMELFAHDPRIRIELVGPPGEVLVPPPPYWFGKKARDNDLPLPREYPARITIGADVPPGLVRWQAANANGATAVGFFLVCDRDAQPEPTARREATADALASPIENLPAAVIGQIQRLEEVDRFAFKAPRDGPITLDVWSRRLGSQLNAILEIRDESGNLIADAADTAGHDLQLTFRARAGGHYTASLFDADFRGYRSFVYRCEIHDGPRVVATIPAAVPAGSTSTIRFLVTGDDADPASIGEIRDPVTIPATAEVGRTFRSSIPTPAGVALAWEFPLSDFAAEENEGSVASAAAPCAALPLAITGMLDEPHHEDRYWLQGTAGAEWSLICRSAKSGRPLDLTLAIEDSEGKELLRADDLVGSLDAGLEFSVPADGAYQVVVADQSGQTGRPDAVYRLVVKRAAPNFTVAIPDRIAVPLGGTAKLPVKVTRQGKIAGEVVVKLDGLPAGITVSEPLIVPAGKQEVIAELTCEADAAVSARPAKATAGSQHHEKTISRQSDLALVAIVMKPRTKITPEGLDDVRKWPRGSTYLAPVLIERLEGFTGEVLLEQTAHQQRVRQGITGPDLLVPPGVSRVEYPVFLPEWLETTKTSRIILNGVVQVPDPQGTVRYLLNKMELRIGMLPVGALLKIAHEADDVAVAAGEPFAIPVEITRSGELQEEATLELIAPGALAADVFAPPVLVPATAARSALAVNWKHPTTSSGELELTIRATVLRDGKWPVIAETTCRVVVRSAAIAP